MAEVSTYTKIITRPDNSGTVTTFANTLGIEVLSADLLGVDPSGSFSQFNYQNVNDGDGVLTVDGDKVPDQLEIVITDEKQLIFIGENASRYSIDQDTGQLKYTTP